MEFSFKNRNKNKKFMRVELMDGTKITIPAPKLGMVNRLNSNFVGKESTIQFSDMIPFVVEILNTNLDGKKFKEAEISSDWDTQDLIGFMTAYSNFVQEVEEEKN